MIRNLRVQLLQNVQLSSGEEDDLSGEIFDSNQPRKRWIMKDRRLTTRYISGEVYYILYEFSTL